MNPGSNGTCSTPERNRLLRLVTFESSQQDSNIYLVSTRDTPQAVEALQYGIALGVWVGGVTMATGLGYTAPLGAGVVFTVVALGGLPTSSAIRRLRPPGTGMVPAA